MSAFKGLGSALSRLKHDLDLQAEPLLADIEDLGTRAVDAIREAKIEVRSFKAGVSDLEDFVQEVRGSNGNPSSAGSSKPSGGSQVLPVTAPAAVAIAAPAVAEAPPAPDAVAPAELAASPIAELPAPAVSATVPPLVSLDVNGVSQDQQGN